MNGSFFQNEGLNTIMEDSNGGLDKSQSSYAKFSDKNDGGDGAKKSKVRRGTKGKKSRSSSKIGGDDENPFGTD